MVLFLVALMAFCQLSFVSARTGPGNVLPGSGECGIRSSKKTGVDESPWHCDIEYTNKPRNETGKFCSCVLINQQYVLTASDCVHADNIIGDQRPYRIKLGNWYKTSGPDCSKADCASRVQKILVSKIVLHPQYDGKSNDRLHDIALIRMDVPVTYSDYVRPICLPKENRLRRMKYAGKSLEVPDWVRDNILATENSKVNVRFHGVEQESCANGYFPIEIKISDTQVCAMAEGGPRSVYSGAPLVAKDNNDSGQTSTYLVGIRSFGIARLVGLPEVFTKVSEYMDWVQRNMEP